MMSEERIGPIKIDEVLMKSYSEQLAELRCANAKLRRRPRHLIVAMVVIITGLCYGGSLLLKEATKELSERRNEIEFHKASIKSMGEANQMLVRKLKHQECVNPLLEEVNDEAN